MTQRCNIVLTNEVIAVLTGVHEQDLARLIEAYSEFVPGYKHMPLYQLGKWDGKVKFVARNRKTFQVFLPEIIQFLISSGYKLSLDDRRPPVVIDVPLVTPDQFAHVGWQHRPHQIRCINAIIENNHKGVILACTGAGKTAIAAGLSHAYHQACGFRSVVIVPSLDLVEQTRKTYEQFQLDVWTLSSSSNEDLNHAHIITTWQTLKNIPAKMLGFEVFICDELQGAKSPVVSSLLIESGGQVPVRIGCTGTMPKEPADYNTIYAAIGAREVAVVKAVELQKLGFLATLSITQMILKDSVHTGQQRYDEYPQEVAALAKLKNRDKFIADFITSLDKNTLVLVGGVKAGKRFQKLIDNSVFVYGKDDTEVRQQVYESFKHHDQLKVLANVQIAAVGLSIDEIHNLVLVDIGKAFTRVIQAIGRGLRVCKTKNHVNVYDIGTDLSFGSGHASKRCTYYAEENYPYTIKKIAYY